MTLGARRVVWTFAAAAAAILVLLGLVTWFQDRLLYFPMRAKADELATRDLRAWPERDDFRGLVAEPQGAPRGTVVVFHGNAGHAGHRAFYAQALAPLGWRVVLAEYPGYGPRDGRHGEASLVADAARIVALVHERHGAPLVVIGESLGAAVAAAAAASEQARVSALLLITPWDRLQHVARYHYPLLPVRWLLRDRYDSVERLASFSRPTTIVVAKHDRIVPAPLGIELYEAIASPKRLVVLEGAGHNDWPSRVSRDWWREQMNALVSPQR